MRMGGKHVKRFDARELQLSTYMSSYMGESIPLIDDSPGEDPIG